MQRRELFRIFGAGAALPALSPDLFAFFQDAQPKSAYTLRTLNPHQNATVVTMAELIIPATETPGAKGARVNEFMDLILTEWAHEDERQKFLDGLADVDKQTNALFSKDFVDCSPLQQETFLREMDQKLAVERQNTPPVISRTPAGDDARFAGSFFRIFKTMTIYGYYTSEIGFTQERKEEMIPGFFHGCTPLNTSSKA
jgi:Gluconate 2-dehydrogenase subunit 3